MRPNGSLLVFSTELCIVITKLCSKTSHENILGKKISLIKINNIYFALFSLFPEFYCVLSFIVCAFFLDRSSVSCTYFNTAVFS